MKRRAIAALLLLASTSLGAANAPPTKASPAKTPAPKTPAPKAPAPKVAVPAPVAPDTLAHPNAMFLSALSDRGARRVTFKASALSTRFFLEEASGVTVYVYDGVNYRRETFLKGSTLEKAIKAYSKKK